MLSNTRLPRSRSTILVERRIRNWATVEPARLDIENFRETMVCVALACGTQDRIFKKINASNGMDGAARRD